MSIKWFRFFLNQKRRGRKSDKQHKTDRVRLVVGGFHLLGNASQLESTIQYFHEHGVELLCPMHCTDLTALCGLAQHFPFKKLCSGDWLELAG